VFVPALPKTRQLQDTEVYSKLFYASKLKGIVDAEIAGMSLTQSEKLAKIVEVTKREWAHESDEVKEQVQVMKEEPRDRSHNLAEGSTTPSPEQYQASIDNLSCVADAFLDHIKRTTGWTGFVVLGGPKPDLGGEIVIGSYVLHIDYLLTQFINAINELGSLLVVTVSNLRSRRFSQLSRAMSSCRLVNM
jgi:hypothetical protein